MPTPDKKPARTLALDEDMRFQHRQWRAERIGWIAMVAIILAALAGVFGGGGPLSRTSASSADGNSEVQYARLTRHTTPATLDINVASADAAGRVRLRVSSEYLETMNVRSIVPPPISTVLGDRQYIFVFERSAAASAAKIRLELEPTALGAKNGWIAINDGAPISFAQFIYP